MNFRELTRDLDDTVFDVAADDALLNGKPVRGMFAAPWLQPQFGRLKTALVEPHIVLRNADAANASHASTLIFEGEDYEVVSIEPDGTGLTTLILRPI